MAENPFERFDLDIAATLPELTRTLRERIEDATSDDERDQLRAIWETLTGKLETRAGLVLGALPHLAAPLPEAVVLGAAPPVPHPLDDQPLPAFPLEWDALTEAEAAHAPAAGHIDLGDPVFAHLLHVVLP